MTILFLRIASKDMFATLKIGDNLMIKYISKQQGEFAISLGF